MAVPRRWAACLALIASTACEGESTPAPVSGGITLTQITYQLDWDPPAETETGGWRTTSNLRLEIEVEVGRAVLATLTLEPCPMDTASTGTITQALHDEIPDPATLPGSHIETLTPPGPRRFDPLDIPPATYCRLSYRAARAFALTEGLETYPEMDQKTLSIQGRWRGPARAWPCSSAAMPAAAAYVLHTRGARRLVGGGGGTL